MRTTVLLVAFLLASSVQAGYVNFETGHVHPLDLTPSGNRLLVVNTPDALLEVFAVASDGSLTWERAIPVGLEPVTVHPRSETEAWVVNNLSDSISIVDLTLGVVVKTLDVGDEPTDVVFANNRAFVSISSEDRVNVYSLPDATYLTSVSLFSRDVRALALSPDGTKVHAVTLRSGNQTTVVNANVVHGLPLKSPGNPPGGLHDLYTYYDLGRPGCIGDPPTPPATEVERNPNLIDPPDGVPKNSIIVRWDEASQAWLDVDGSDWTHCVRFALPDYDLFSIDTTSYAVTTVSHLGTTLFDVSVHPGNGKIYVPNTDARNFVRFEREGGLRGHSVDNRLSIVDPANGNAVTVIDLNAHIDRQSDPQTNLTERLASISQPGMMAWRSDGSAAFLTGLGSRKVFRVPGTCRAGSCIFGPDRANPVAVEAGLGPSGLALREAAQPEDERLYVLNRIDHSLAIVDTAQMAVVETLPLHDPSSVATRVGRNFLYEATFASAHGDMSCASCHPFGDMDGLAWELGNPQAELRSYGLPYDNVRFVPTDGTDPPTPPGTCEVLSNCADHQGFDPQKGPLVTQTLRGMLEPLHWRGDRATFRDFNQTFVQLLGSANIAQPGETDAGLPDAQMEQFRQFALEMRFPPNPHRSIEDMVPCGPRSIDPDCEVQVHGNILPGNPQEGERLFQSTLSWGGSRTCRSCHSSLFGQAGGLPGGLEPSEPTSVLATALHSGSFTTEFPVRHFDLEVPHLRNLYEKFGPNPSSTMTLIPSVAGFGYSHDGSLPDLARFATTSIFTLHPDNGWQDLRDLVAFLFTFPTGTKPAVGRQVTVPAGTPPTGSAADEALVATLEAYAPSLSHPLRHCELVATTLAGGRQRSYVYSDGAWFTDVAGEPTVTTVALREGAQAPITFTCATRDAGPRLGGDRDEDGALNGDDCAPADAGALAVPLAIENLALESTQLGWDDQAATAGSDVRYQLLGGNLSALASAGLSAATVCLDAEITTAAYEDTRPDPAAGDGYYYLVRATNVCGASDLGPGREVLSSVCP